METIKTDVQPVVAEEVKKDEVVVPELSEAEERIKTLEAEKAKAIEESANYKLAFLKEKNKKDLPDFEESEEERIARIVQQTLSETKIAQIDAEKEALLKQTLKENRELKLAQLNKGTPPASIGTHSEGTPVTDTLVTNQQMEAFKARGWSDKDIERYKKNLLKNTR